MTSATRQAVAAIAYGDLADQAKMAGDQGVRRDALWRDELTDVVIPVDDAAGDRLGDGDQGRRRLRRQLWRTAGQSRHQDQQRAACRLATPLRGGASASSDLDHVRRCPLNSRGARRARQGGASPGPKQDGAGQGKP